MFGEKHELIGHEYSLKDAAWAALDPTDCYFYYHHPFRIHRSLTGVLGAEGLGDVPPPPPKEPPSTP